MLKKIKHLWIGFMSWLHIILKNFTEKMQAKQEEQRKILAELKTKKK